MFWGLIMEPQKRYSQVIKKAFHISMASLDVSNSDDQPAQILCGYDGKNYLLCTLQKPDKLQCNLDLYFEEGHAVSFASNGKSLVHLTGYLTKDALEEDTDEESDNEFEVQGKKNSRKSKAKEEPSSKKIKLDYLFKDCKEEEDSDDSDFNIDQLMEDEESGEESGEEEGSANEDIEEEENSLDEEEDENEEEEAEEAEEEEDSDDDDDLEEIEAEDEEEQVVKEKVLQNGLSKKSKKNKKKEEPETPTKKNKQNKEKPQLTPGPKTKKQEKSSTENSVEKKGKGKEERKSQETQAAASPKKRTLSNGIIVEDLRIGQGDAATNGKFIHVYYEGRLKTNNKVFDKSMNGPGFGFRLGKGEVIKGWDIGVNGMKVGGKRRIICPPQVAYGARGSPPVIPPNATLVFEVEVKKVK